MSGSRFDASEKCWLELQPTFTAECKSLISMFVHSAISCTKHPVTIKNVGYIELEANETTSDSEFRDWALLSWLNGVGANAGCKTFD